MDYKNINIPRPPKLWRILFIIILFLVLAPFIVPPVKEKIVEVRDGEVEKLADEEGYYRVARIIDGDTIELFGGVKVRYIGIDTPEKDTDFTKYECFSDEATVKNKELLEGMKVKLVSGDEDKDKYGRWLRYVYLPDGTFVNLELIKQGYAEILFIPPNMDFYDEFKQAEKEAEEKGLGMWGACE